MQYQSSSVSLTPYLSFESSFLWLTNTVNLVRHFVLGQIFIKSTDSSPKEDFFFYVCSFILSRVKYFYRAKQIMYPLQKTEELRTGDKSRKKKNQIKDGGINKSQCFH